MTKIDIGIRLPPKSSRIWDSLYLAAGVTTVRDTGSDLDWILDQREKLAKDPKLGPTMVCCGFALDGPEGYMASCRPQPRQC